MKCLVACLVISYHGFNLDSKKRSWDMLGVYSTLMDALNRLQKLDSKISSELRSPKQA